MFFTRWLSRLTRKASPIRRRPPLCLERLEDRTVPATITWALSGSGAWDVPGNWVGGNVPGTGDDAVISTASAATITIQSSDSILVQSVTTAATDTLSIAGGQLLVIAGTSTLSGPLTMSGGNLTAAGAGTNLTANGTTTVPGANLAANGGATLSLPQLTSYSSDGTFQADGSGSVLDVSKLTTVTQPLGPWAIEATDGGEINLSGMTSLTAANGNSIGIVDTGGSTLLDPNVTSLSGVSATLDGSDPHVADSWTKFVSGTLAVQQGSYSLPGLTNVDLSNLTVLQGGSLTLLGVTSYSSDGTFLVDGTGSVLDLSKLTTLTQPLGGWNIEATNGGELNLTGMTSLTSTNGNSILLADQDGSTLLDPNVTSLSGVTADIDGTDAHVADSWTKFVSGSLNVTLGSYSLPGLTDVDLSNLSATKGGHLALPGLKSYSSDGTFLADGTGSLLDVSALTTVTQPLGSWNIEATNGGVLNLSGMTSLTSTNGNSITLVDQVGSTVVDPHVTSLSGVTADLDGSDANVGDAWTTFTGGALNLTVGATTLPSLTDVGNPGLTFDGTATLSLPVLTMGTLTLTNGQTVTIQGTPVSLPTDGSSNATINVPQSKSLTVVLQNNGTLNGVTALNVGNGTTVDLAGGTYNGGVTFSVGAGALVDLTGGQTDTYIGTLSGTGAGTVQLATGDLIVGIGGITLNFPGTMFQWTGAQIDTAAGNVTNMGTMNITGPATLVNDGTLDDFGSILQTGAGSLTFSGDGISPTTLMIEAGGFYLISGDSGFSSDTTDAIVNAGKIAKTAGAGTSTVTVDGPITNTGTIEADSGTLALAPTSLTQLSGTTLTAGTWNALNGATLIFPSGTNITTNHATIAIDGAHAAVVGIANLASNAGSFSLTNGADFTTAGNLANSAALTVGTGSTLSVTGSFTQTGAGTLNDQIGGTPASGLFGQVAVTKAAALAGTFDLAIVNSFTPSPGQMFDVVTFTSATGAFTSFVGLSPLFIQSLTGSAEVLTVVQPPAFTSVTSAAFTTGSSGSFTVTASGFPAPTLSESDSDTLPSGVTFNAATGALGGTPAANAGGIYTLHFTAANGIGSDATQTFTLTVNQPSAFTSANNTAFTLGTADTFTVAASGFPASTLSESNTDTLPSGVTFTPATGVLAGTPAAGTDGTYTLHFTAHNGIGADATQTFTLTVATTLPPAFTSSNATAFTVATAGSFTVTASGAPAPTLSESNTDTLPSGVTFTPATGVLSGTPAVGSTGTYTLHFTAHNGIGTDATQTFTLTVDQPAAFTSAANTAFAVGSAGSFTVAASGFPAPSLTESNTDTLPSGVTFTPATGVLAGTPAADSGGAYTLHFTAHNGVGADATQTFTLTVDQPAAFTSANNTAFTVGTAGSFTVAASGFPAPTLSESNTDTLPSGVTFTAATGVLAGTPAAGSAGTYTLHFTAHNGIGSDATQTFTLTVNQPAAFTSANNATFAVGSAGTFTVTASGAPAPVLSESGSDTLPSGVTFTPATGVLAGTPAVGTGGTYTLHFTAHNGVGSDATQTFTLTVTTTQPPAFTSANNTSFSTGTAGSFTVTASGLPAPTLSESNTDTLPSGVSFTAATGVLAGTPAAGSAGTYTLHFTAHNGIGSDATQTFTLTVNQPAAFTSANNTAFAVGSADTFTVTASGAPAPVLSESGSDTLPSGVTFTPATGVLAGTPAVGTGGTYTLHFTAHNGVGSDATQTFTLTVVQTPLSITTTMLPSYLTQGQTYNATIATTGGAAPIAFSVSVGTLPAGLSLAPSTGVISGTPTAFGTSTFTVQAQGASGAPATQAYTVVILPPEFAYNPTTQTLVITLVPSLPSFQFTEVTTASGGTTSSVYTFTLSGSSAPTVTQSFPSSMLTTSPASGSASVSVTGQGLAGTAILITNDTYVDQNGNTQQTPARISLGSLTDDGAGTLSKFVGNNLNNAEYSFLSLENFPLSYAYAGRNDGTIQLYGTENTGKVGFVTAGYYSYIASAVTGVYAHFGEGTPEVIGTSADNADDFAYHYTSSSPSTVSTVTSVFTVNGITSSSMAGSQTNPEDNGNVDTFDNIANGFVLNTAVAYSGNSIAHINDSPMSDTYVGEATDPLGLVSLGGIAGYSYMFVGAFPSFNEFDVAYGFGTYYASSTMGGNDIAYPGAPANNVFSGNWVRTF